MFTIFFVKYGKNLLYYKDSPCSFRRRFLPEMLKTEIIIRSCRHAYRLAPVRTERGGYHFSSSFYREYP